MTTEELNNLISTQHKSIVFIYGDECFPCKVLKPIVTEIANEKGIPITFVNGPENINFCKSLGLSKVPSVIFVGNGNILAKKTGMISKSEIISLCEL